MTASATTNPPRARYCVPSERDWCAARLASQLTSTKPPSTNSQLVPSIARAMTSARPVVKKNISTRTKPMIAPNRWA